MYLKIAASMALCIMLSVIPALAEPPVEAEIPFAFQAGKIKLPAGTYKVTFPTSTLMLIKSSDNTSSSFLMTMSTIRPGNERERAKLVFNRYGDRYFLNQVWTGGTESGRLLQQTKAEVEAARLAPRPSGPQVATIPARR